MSVHKPLPPTKSFSTAHVGLYDITCNDFLLDTRRSLSSPYVVKFNDLKKQLRRKRDAAVTPSSQNVRARTNKILHMQHRMRRDIFKEFVKSAGITAKGLKTIQDVNSEEHFWKHDKTDSHLIGISESRLALQKSKAAALENIHVFHKSFSVTSPSQMYLDIVKRTGVKNSVSEISLTRYRSDASSEADKLERPASAPPTSATELELLRYKKSHLAESRSRLMMGKRKFQKIKPFEPDLYDNEPQGEIETIYESDYYTALPKHEVELDIRSNHELQPAEDRPIKSRFPSVNSDKSRTDSKKGSRILSHPLSTSSQLKTKSNHQPRYEDLIFHSKSGSVVHPSDLDVKVSKLESITQDSHEKRSHHHVSEKGKLRKAVLKSSTTGSYTDRILHDSDELVAIPLKSQTSHQDETDEKRSHKLYMNNRDDKLPLPTRDGKPTLQKRQERFALQRSQDKISLPKLEEKSSIKLKKSLSRHLHDDMPLPEPLLDLSSKLQRHETIPTTTSTTMMMRVELENIDWNAEPPLERTLSRLHNPDSGDEAILDESGLSLTKVVSQPRLVPILPPAQPTEPQPVRVVEDLKRKSLTNERQRVHDIPKGRLSRGSTIKLSDSDIEQDDFDSDMSSSMNLLEKEPYRRVKLKYKKFGRKKKQQEEEIVEEKTAEMQHEAEEFVELQPLPQIKAPSKQRSSDYDDSNDFGGDDDDMTGGADAGGAGAGAGLGAGEDDDDDFGVDKDGDNNDDDANKQPTVENTDDEVVHEPVTPEVDPNAGKIIEEPVPIRKISIYSEIISEPESLEYRLRGEYSYINPLLEQLLAEPDLGRFVTPVYEKKGKPAKKEKPAKKGKALPPPPPQPPTGLCTYENEVTTDMKVKTMEFMYQKSHNLELSRTTAKFRHFEDKCKEREKAQPWLQGRLAFSKQICRFEIPHDIHKLQGMSPVEYLGNYSVVTPRRIKLYMEVFDRQLVRRKASQKRDSQFKNRNSVAPKNNAHQTMTFVSGGANLILGDLKTKTVIDSDMNNLMESQRGSIMNRQSNVQPRNDSLTVKEAANGLAEIHVGAVEERQVKKMFRLLRLDDEPNLMIDSKLFCGMCALMERMFYLQFLVTDAQLAPNESGTRVMLEIADFFGFNARIQDLRLQPGMRELFNVLTQ